MEDMYSNSLIDITKDTIGGTTGEVIVANGLIELKGDSSVTYDYTFGENSVLLTDGLMLKLDTNMSDITTESRYNELVYVDITISYTTGGFTNCRIYPYYIREKDGYIRDYMIATKREYIDTIRIKFGTKGLIDRIVKLSNIQLSTKLSLSESVGQVLDNVHLRKVDTYDNGLVAYYEGIEQPATLKVETIDINNYIINVSDKYSFYLVINSGNMPY